MVLNDVKDALEALFPDEPVDYGMATSVREKDLWDYVVFNRETIRTSDRQGYTDRVNVAIVREEYVPQDDIDAVIAALSAIPGVRLDTTKDIAFAYLAKPGSNAVVEMAELPFLRARKKSLDNG